VDRAGGFTMVELLLVLALGATLVSVALPSTQDAVDAMRTAGAARYLAARLMGARVDAISRSTCIALRFTSSGPDYTFRLYADGNGNGVRTLDISAGVDTPFGEINRLENRFSGVAFGLMNGYPDADDVEGTGSDGVRIGGTSLLTLSPDGTATAGTLYIHGRRAQYAVRILGTTGRVRVLEFLPERRRWISH
jgi:prepilin-type N-terminal cleavage/methylation domain-containing protein